ncbi:uncharacterized protein LOC135077813 [Ostrinia nubilalis]|uniref:uncharacterized protein LOC135077813 n=1 Tax=Ostrinia nubilalis TaxID=29057 RepID=UPI0030822BD8
MQKLFAILCVSVSLELVYSVVSRQKPVEKPAEFASEEGCYNPDLNMVLPYNVTYSSPDQTMCKGYLCEISGFTQIFTCGVVVGPEGCEVIPGDVSKPYPDCCSTISCDPSSDGTVLAVA